MGNSENERRLRTAALSDADIAKEEEFLEGLPLINVGALFMPGIWGPAHGFWACILFYPLYLLADNLFYGAYETGEPWMIALAVFGGIVLTVLHVAFARLGVPLSAHKAENSGVSREVYLKRERIWAVVSIVLAIAAIAWATYFNLNIRPTL